ncbi:glycosyltransferase [Rhodococcus sp. NPDC058521]|uniref:glycosyltransferase n=1 Tax=Rhodococcus sp. NPDC058521 TaxID=3346536 RepID=UPI00364D0F2F
MSGLDILVWHVHGSWTTAFVQGRHRYLVPCLPEGGQWGRGVCGREWPQSVVEVTPDELAESNVDVVVLQRPQELELVEEWLGRRPGRDVPALYLEHNTPTSSAAKSRHPLAGQTSIPIVHVTAFNDLMWDNGIAIRHVIPHGIVDPGHRYTGELPRAASMINEPSRRARVTGSDLLVHLSTAAPLDVFGIGTREWAQSCTGFVTGCGDLPTDDLHREVARRRVFVHTARWTSLGLSLIEAMHLGMPIVVLATTEAPSSVPSEAGVCSTEPSELSRTLRDFVHDPARANMCGKVARQFALQRFGIAPFLRRWDELLADAAGP